MNLYKDPLTGVRGDTLWTAYVDNYREEAVLGERKGFKGWIKFLWHGRYRKGSAHISSTWSVVVNPSQKYVATSAANRRFVANLVSTGPAYKADEETVKKNIFIWKK